MTQKCLISHSDASEGHLTQKGTHMTDLKDLIHFYSTCCSQKYCSDCPYLDSYLCTHPINARYSDVLKYLRELDQIKTKSEIESKIKQEESLRDKLKKSEETINFYKKIILGLADQIATGQEPDVIKQVFKGVPLYIFEYLCFRPISCEKCLHLDGSISCKDCEFGFYGKYKGDKPDD